MQPVPPEGRSLPAGDPRATRESPYYEDDPYAYWLAKKERGSRATPVDKLPRRPRFHRAKPFYYDDYAEEPDIPISSVGEWGRAAASSGQPRDRAEKATSLLWNHVKQAKRKEAERQHEQANNSFRETKRTRDMQIINQAVAQQVPAQPPFQRSFIPHDLWHMLSPNDS